MRPKQWPPASATPYLDDLHRDVSLSARRIGHAVDVTVRAARQALPERRVLSFIKRERKPDYIKADHGLIIYSGEVGLGPSDQPQRSTRWPPGGSTRAARLVLSPVTADNIGKQGRELPTPWPEAGRDALLEMLSTGPNLLPVWEALDLAGCISRWIPSWEPIRARPQHNPVHRHTVDRHLVQTVAEVQRYLTRVDRPDILLLACLFHDIGKLPGAGVHHAARGAPIAREAVEAIGLNQADAELVEHLVRHHLTLAGLATKRDHADPATLDALVEAVQGRADILDLLRCLTEADARAAGPAAWSPWRAQLINSLADHTEGQLVDEGTRVDVSELVDVGLARSVQLDGRPRIRVEPQPGGVQLVIAAATGSVFSATPPACLPRIRCRCDQQSSTRSKGWPSTPGGWTSRCRLTCPTPRTWSNSWYVWRRVRRASLRRCNAVRPAPTAAVRRPTPMWS